MNVIANIANMMYDTTGLQDVIANIANVMYDTTGSQADKLQVTAYNHIVCYTMMLT